MPRALLTCRQIQSGFPLLKPQYEALGVEAVLPSIPGQQLDAVAMRTHIVGMDAVIAGDDVIDESVFKAGSKLKAVIKWGVGTDSIDKDVAQRLGIPVFNTPGVFSDEVADLAMGLLLGVVRRTHEMDSAIRAGAWNRLEGRTLAGKTAGVIGLGSIGLGIARRARAFGMQVVGCDVRALTRAELAEQGVRQAPLSNVLAESDVLLLACNLTAENRHLLDAAAFAAMKPGVVIINVSRGPLIHEPSLIAALESGQVAGAGLDVFEEEPLPLTSPLHRFRQCVFTAHAGSSTQEAISRINQMTTDILFHVLKLKLLTHVQLNRVA